MGETLHPEETVTTIILVRHGHTQQTESGKLYSDFAARLTEKGITQAKAIAEWMPREKVDLLLSSRAERVQATAKIVAEAISMSPQILTNLDEQNVGEWEDRTYMDIKKNNPQEYALWCADPVRQAPPGGESIEQMFQRVQRSLSELLSEHSGKRIALVSHAGVIRSILIGALGMPVDNFWRLAVGTGTASRVDFSSNFATVQFMSVKP